MSPENFSGSQARVIAPARRRRPGRARGRRRGPNGLCWPAFGRPWSPDAASGSAFRPLAARRAAAGAWGAIIRLTGLQGARAVAPGRGLLLGKTAPRRESGFPLFPPLIRAFTPPPCLDGPKARWKIRLNGRLTHRFPFSRQERALWRIWPDLCTQAALILVIDDLGRESGAPPRIWRLCPFPWLWPSGRTRPGRGRRQIWPDRWAWIAWCICPWSLCPAPTASAPEAGSGCPVRGYEPRALASVLEPDLAALPTALGLNNHMGSRFTGSAASTAAPVCAQLAGRGFFVLDSLTPFPAGGGKPAPPGWSSAAQAVSGYAPGRFRRAGRLGRGGGGARSAGFAVAIGHPYAETLGAAAGGQGPVVAVLPLRRLVWHLAQLQTRDGTRADSR